MKKLKEIPIGGIGVIDGCRVMAKEYLPENSCDDCCFSRNAGYCPDCPSNKCEAKRREDKTDVYFIRVESEVKDA